MTAVRQVEGRVEALLREQSHEVERIGAGRWSCALPTGADGAAQAQLEEGWLTIRLSLAHCQLVAWEALAMNRGLPGLCKVVVADDGHTLEAVADIPLTGLAEGGLERRLAEALADIGCAPAGRRGEGQPRTTGDELADGITAADVPALLRESGWPVTVRPSGAAAVRLDVPGEFCQALVAQEQNTGGVRLEADLGETGNLSAASRQATALLMLRASAATRLARAYASRDPQETVGFEVAFSAPVTPAEMGHALSALSVACRLCRRELAALRDETVAREYLVANGRDD